MFAGSCRLGPIQLVVSHPMLDTLGNVLVRIGFPDHLAEASRNAVEAAAAGGGEAPHAVLSGGVQPLLDTEDRGVLETAVAARADLLVTNNMADFAPGPRAGIDADLVRMDPKGRPDVLRLRHARLRHARLRHARLQQGLVMASVPASRAWLLEGVLPPPGILTRFLPG